MKNTASWFENVRPVEYRWYDPDRKVLGRRMEEQMRIAVCFWHSFVWNGADPFGGETFARPWHAPGDAMQRSRDKVDTAFELFRLLRAPFFTFHDLDIAPEGDTWRATRGNVRAMAERVGERMEETGVKLLWGMANLTSHRRYMAGAATNPDPEVFAYAAAQVKNALEITHELRGEGYALWGGREGYETLLNTDVGRELDQLGRFIALVVEHKHRIGFRGPILIETKPAEPCKHHYDSDVATVYGFLRRYGLESEVRVNLEQNHALLAGHNFEHEIALAQALGVFGSIDINRGDELLGWDTVHFPGNLAHVALTLYYVLRGGGFTSGGLNLDARVRRQSIDAEDLVLAHAEAIDLCARALLIAEKMIRDDALAREIRQRYSGWEGRLGRDIRAGRMSLDKLARHVDRNELEPQPRSGHQERLEALVNSYL
jgi:xylose isomerase